MFKYRKKRRFWTSNKENKWDECTAEQKVQIETSAPAKFEFKEIKQPKPTPSMEKAKKSTKKPTEEVK